MAELKTVPNDSSVEEYLAGIADEQRRSDSRQICQLMQSITKEKPVMWGPSIVGFGKYHYKYASGREGDSVIVGFSARKQALVLYYTAWFIMIKIWRRLSSSEKFS